MFDSLMILLKYSFVNYKLFRSPSGDKFPVFVYRRIKTRIGIFHSKTPYITTVVIMIECRAARTRFLQRCPFLSRFLGSRNADSVFG